MNKKIAYVLKGYTVLTESEKNELIKYINDIKSGGFKSRSINEDMDKVLGVTFGPAPNSCSCCGR